MVLVGILGILSEVLVYRRPLKSGEHVNGFISSFGILVFLESFALIFFGSQYKRIYTSITLRSQYFWCHLYDAATSCRNYGFSDHRRAASVYRKTPVGWRFELFLKSLKERS